MICTDKMMINIFSDTNIDKDERYMLLMFITNTIKGKDAIAMSIKTLLEVFECKGKKTVLNIIKSLEKKGYIEIIKSIGKVNQYKVIKYIDGFLSEDSCSLQEDSILEDDSISTSVSTYPSENNIRNLSADTYTPEDTSVSTRTGTYTPRDTSIISRPGALSKENNAGRSENTNVSASASKNDDRYINNKYINNNKLYIYIFNAWNKLNINNEKILTEDNKSAIANALNEHNEEDIINAIENFGVVYKSDHYYNYAWILKSFLSRSNGINRFMEDGDIWLDYKAKQKNVKRNSIFPEDFDIEKYID
ncbi:hypothetical protein [Clostridium disporicum]|uniref:hypothetical protein n=1 Tax=Clostridium disporicum TaxID=84024 RepID=UPI0006C2B6B1|nr:hypothetical protein [Clostridium disporicum]CUO85256.1 Uncharacterised protein [Clostridium disporicum]